MHVLGNMYYDYVLEAVHHHKYACDHESPTIQASSSMMSPSLGRPASVSLVQQRCVGWRLRKIHLTHQPKASTEHRHAWASHLQYSMYLQCDMKNVGPAPSYQGKYTPQDTPQDRDGGMHPRLSLADSQ